VIVLNSNHEDDLSVASTFELKDQAPLVIKPHRVLMRAVALQLLKMQRFHGVERPFVLSGSNCLHPLPKCPNDHLRPTTIKGRIGFESIKGCVTVADLHQHKCTISLVSCQHVELHKV